MPRRTILLAPALLLLTPALAWAQAAPGISIGSDALPQAPQRPPSEEAIEPHNRLEELLVAAFQARQSTPAFRHAFLTSPVVLAVEGAAADASPLLVTLTPEGAPPFHGGAVFTSPVRLQAAMPHAHYVTVTGRQALTRLRQQGVVLNLHSVPMLTLGPSDIADWLATPPPAHSQPASPAH